MRDPVLYNPFLLHKLQHGFGLGSQSFVFKRGGVGFAQVGSNVKTVSSRFRAELECLWFKLNFPSCSWKFSQILSHSFCSVWFCFISTLSFCW